MRPRSSKLARWLWLLLALCSGGSAAPLPELVKQIKPSVIGVGTYDPLGSPRGNLLGTGFLVAKGRHVVTAFHLASPDTPGAVTSTSPQLAVFMGLGQRAEIRLATRVRADAQHDLAVLEIEGAPGASLRLGPQDLPDEGMAIAIMGYPIGNTLGLHPLTHAGIVASVSPVALPHPDAASLSAERIRHLRQPFPVILLDLIAYPGNSGSPVFDHDGQVRGVVSGVYLRSIREGAVSAPSAITYAIPVAHVLPLLEGL